MKAKRLPLQFRSLFNVSFATLFAGLIVILPASHAVAETKEEQEALEKVAVAFASMVWLPRLDAACALYKKGLIDESQLPEAYRVLYKSMAVDKPTSDRDKTFPKLMELIEAGPKAMAEYMDAENPNAFENGYFADCPLPGKALGY